MTSLDPGSVSTLAPAIAAHAVITDALHHALRRDLGRLTRVLGEPVTAVRRGALIEHIGFLLDQLQAQHRLLDEVSWPAVTTARPDLLDVADRVRTSHRELATPIVDVAAATLEWRDHPGRRLTVLSVVRELESALRPVLDQDAELAGQIDDVLGFGPATEQRTSWSGAPTRIARRTFWLLDELDPRQAAVLARRTPRAAMWILRNGFSGAYNRSSYLMWTGGGTGPAV